VDCQYFQSLGLRREEWTTTPRRPHFFCFQFSFRGEEKTDWESWDCSFASCAGHLIYSIRVRTLVSEIHSWFIDFNSNHIVLYCTISFPSSPSQGVDLWVTSPPCHGHRPTHDRKPVNSLSTVMRESRREVVVLAHVKYWHAD